MVGCSFYAGISSMADARFDSGCSAVAFWILSEYTLLRCTRTGDRRNDDCSRNL